jgi:hypothetical protein
MENANKCKYVGEMSLEHHHQYVSCMHGCVISSEIDGKAQNVNKECSGRPCHSTDDGNVETVLQAFMSLVPVKPVLIASGDVRSRDPR